MTVLDFPSGFQAWGLHSGIGKRGSKPDLALFFSRRTCEAAGVFTRNRVKAAPVLVSRDQLRGGKASAVVVNSGCANACTGGRGMKDALETVKEAGSALGVPQAEVLVASTGVIGQFLPMEKLKRGLGALGGFLLKGRNDPLKAVRAIMTTDTVPKFEGRSVRAAGGSYRIWGCVKGAGMIHPNMATMISVLLTDADVPAGRLKRALKAAVDISYNCSSVDGDTSTNDSVFVLANGASGVKLVSAAQLGKFQNALSELCLSLARKMVSDGEGATKRVEISVSGARSQAQAKKVAAAVAASPLVKTAMFGNDANWGRILAAIGRSGADIDPGKIRLAFDGLKVVRNGVGLPFSEREGIRILRQKVVPVSIDLGIGKAAARALTCDFSFGYVKINAEYRT